MNTKAITTAFILALAAAMPAAQAQPRTTAASAAPAPADTGVPNALQGFQQNRGQPVNIEAARLEVRDKQKVATFSGKVKVVQGDTIMHCNTLVVFYEQKTDTPGAPPAQPMPAAQPGPGGASQISRLEAKGNVIVTQKDQTATGDNGVFDMKANTVTLISNVTVSQGPNVVRGERLVVDLTTGVSKVDAGNGGPVRMLIQNGAPQQAGGASPQANSATPASPFAPPRFGPQQR